MRPHLVTKQEVDVIRFIVATLGATVALALAGVASADTPHTKQQNVISYVERSASSSAVALQRFLRKVEPLRAKANECRAQSDRTPWNVSDRTPVGRLYQRWVVRTWTWRKQTACRYASRLATPEGAICHVFGSRCGEAIRVARCESRFDTGARNGQYLGLFQMGTWERRTYGHGDTLLAQAKAAHRYFVASGSDWSPWQCKPWL